MEIKMTQVKTMELEMTTSCCDDDCCTPVEVAAVVATAKSEQAIREAVHQRYDRIATGFDSSCCSPESSLYETDLSALPTDVTGLSLGCGDPITLANLEAGQTVLDLGSGGGIDCFLAAQRVGESGYVIGVDMTDSMLEKARRNQSKMGLANVEFRKGQIEALPVEDASIDVLISNCVINLSPTKETVVAEAFRVLRPGGKFAVSDMVTMGHFSAEERQNMSAWSACIAGAEDAGRFASMLRDAGFVDVSVRDKDDREVELGTILTETVGKPKLISASITAWKPVGG
jgi:ubiquinone/menaquinone biosynthesis C-methylase UbiE